MNSRILQLFCALIIALSAASCSKRVPANREEKTLYTCSMHPQVIQDHPGDCPICGMKLVPVRKQPSPASRKETKAGTNRKIKYYKSTMLLGEISQTPRKDSMGMDMVPVYEGEEETNTISVDPATVQEMNVRTGIVTKGPLRRIIRTVGVIDYNETALADVTTKFRGWIEKLYVDSTGKQVHKGEPLFDIYSPELYSAQSEYVLALNQGASALKQSARQKLKLFDVSEDQIAELEKSRQAQRTFGWTRPIDGIVVEKNGGAGTDGRGRDEVVPAGRSRDRLGPITNLRAGPRAVEVGTGSGSQPFLLAGPEISRPRHLHLSDRR